MAKTITLLSLMFVPYEKVKNRGRLVGKIKNQFNNQSPFIKEVSRKKGEELIALYKKGDLQKNMNKLYAVAAKEIQQSYRRGPGPIRRPLHIAVKHAIQDMRSNK